MLRRIFSILFASAMIFSFTACGNEIEQKLVVGVDDKFPPMGFRDSSGDMIGFDIDFAFATAKKMGYAIEIKPIDWSTKEEQLISGNIDVIWNGYTITEARKEKVDFSRPYLKNRQVIVTINNSSIYSKNDLKNTIIGVQEKSSGEEAVMADPIYDELNDKLKTYPEYISAINELINGNISAVIIDEVVADYYITKHPGNFKILEDDFGEEEYGVGVSKENKELSEKLQAAIDEVIKTGEAEKISKKWFGRDNIIK